ncbi:3-isopropylmalate dehydrogenase [Hyaloscypha variabilis F]|uniref:3-isopropylmalate dehydrogenase n=1 Tax=Hyaloscypha variabilis (strain UAMH 11265 / GT02V1 / F) TaxID=1149755 RepID=A0A2J6S8E7_HYAVF|nr:3-isopropylmalate dehydrogenase [Hyaloscypha variabilis F]
MPLFNILVLGGDHIGPEVVAEAVKVIRAAEAHPAVSKKNINFNLDFDLLGGQSIDVHGIPLTPQVVEKAKKSHAVLFGAVGGPKWGMTGALRPETSVLDLRKALNCWANIRPCKIPSPGVAKCSPVKESVVKGTDFIVLRENCGGVYFGEKMETADYSHDVWGYHRWEIERIARMAAYLARKHGGATGPSKITSIDKANVLAVCRLWRDAVARVHDDEFPEIPLFNQLSDSLALLMVKNPRSLNGIVLCDNIFGDLFSDEAAAIVGSLGFSPSACLAGIPGGEEKTTGMYEPSHGSAPDLAPNKANPIATIQSAAMMLRYSCDLDFLADAIDDAISIALDDKAARGLEVRTGDIGGAASTTEMGDAVVSALNQVLNNLKI